MLNFKHIHLKLAKNPKNCQVEFTIFVHFCFYFLDYYLSDSLNFNLLIDFLITIPIAVRT